MEGVAQAGAQERNLQVYIFTSHPTLLDPLSAWASSPPPPLLGKKGNQPAQAPSHQTAPV